VGQLVSSYRKSVHDLLVRVTPCHGTAIESRRASPRCQRLRIRTTKKVYDLVETLDGIEVDMRALDTCQYSHSVIGQLISTIQKKVDQLVVGKYHGLRNRVDEIDKEIESKLARRVEEAIHVWTKTLSGAIWRRKRRRTRFGPRLSA